MTELGFLNLVQCVAHPRRFLPCTFVASGSPFECYKHQSNAIGGVGHVASIGRPNLHKLYVRKMHDAERRRHYNLRQTRWIITVACIILITWHPPDDDDDYCQLLLGWIRAVLTHSYWTWPTRYFAFEITHTRKNARFAEGCILISNATTAIARTRLPIHKFPTHTHWFRRILFE